MSLTPSQLLTLKGDILANTATIPAGQLWTGSFAGMQVKDVPNSPDGNQAVAGWYNLLTADKYAWQFSRTRMDNRRAILNTAGAGNQLDALTGSKRDSLLWCLDDTIEPKLASVRTTIEDLCGSQNTLKGAIIDSFKRLLTNCEVLLKLAGTGTFASPFDGGFQGQVNGDDINSALNLS